jgi:hypothetical protein
MRTQRNAIKVLNFFVVFVAQCGVIRMTWGTHGAWAGKGKGAVGTFAQMGSV